MVCLVSLIASIFVFPINTFAKESAQSKFVTTEINANSTALYVFYTSTALPN